MLSLKAGQCPYLDGDYAIGDEAMYRALAAHYDKEPRKWVVASVGGDPQTELRVRLYEAGTGAPIEEAVRRRRGSDYDCDDGWLRMRWPGGMQLLGEGERVPEGDQFDKTIAFAKNRDGDLVARIEISHWKGVAVWCGDGCKYLPIPFTRSNSFSWQRWTTSAIPPRRFDFVAAGPDGVVDTRTPAQIAASKAWEADQQVRRAASIAQREREERIVKLLLPNLPKGMVLTNFTTRGQGFVAELRHLDRHSFADLVDNLRASGHFSDAELGDWKYTDGYGRQVADVTLTVQPQDGEPAAAAVPKR